jgi:hypothetical protein
MAEAVRDLTAKQNEIREKAELLTSLGNEAPADLKNDLFREQTNLNQQAIALRDQLTRLVGYAGTVLDGKIKDILNIKEPINALQENNAARDLAKDLALSPEVVAVPGASNLNNLLSDKEVNELSAPLQTKIQPSQSAPPASPEEEDRSGVVSRQKIGEKIGQAERETNPEKALASWIHVREDVANLAAVSLPDFKKVEKLLELTLEHEMKNVLTQEERPLFLEEIGWLKQTIQPAEAVHHSSITRLRNRSI